MTTQLLLLSSSNVHGYGFLEQPGEDIHRFFAGRRRIAFVPFALADHAGYTQTVADRFRAIDPTFDVQQIDDLKDAEGIFIGGGNTFRLLKTLYERNLLQKIRDAVRNGVPYMGSSAGTVISAPTMRTTNDMPIVEPPSLDSFGFVDFQINCHYLDPDPGGTHKGETREERILQFHEENATPVVGIREGTLLRVEDGSATLLGIANARVFRRGREAVEVAPGTVLDAYL
ncbi:MAG: dipeptidase PepE [Acidobacteria bacterium]|nr:dipeptidase PepE [Acidobacteriota bacterium]